MSSTHVAPQSGGTSSLDRAGRMTAVMRAAHAGHLGPKVLRVCLVRGGRILVERLLTDRTPVTVGASESAMFVVDSPHVAGTFVLFERVGKTYRLNVPLATTGQVALASDLHPIDGTRAYAIELTDDARGKLTLGEVTILFQFVLPPPLVARPRLPLAVQSAIASRIDWNLTIIAAFSFLVHFGVLGGLLSDWMDPVVSEDVSIAGLIDERRHSTPPPLEAPAEERLAPPRQVAPQDLQRRVSDDAVPVSPRARVRVTEDRQAQRLSEAAARLQLDLIGALSAPTAVDATLRRGERPTADLSDAARAASGVTFRETELAMVTGAPLMATPRGSLADIAVLDGPGKGEEAGKERQVSGPSTEARIGAPVTSAPVANVERTIAGLKAKLKRCYDRGLAVNPGMSGAVTVMTRVAPNGEVLSTAPQSVAGLDSDVVTCIERVVRSATFEAPGRGGATVNIPVKFVQQSR